MHSSEVRKKFIDFFSSKGHQIVESSSVLPLDDQTLLFTNSGMNQFKDVFLGAEKRDYLTATSAQRCIRAGGKHNDLENVGYTLRHHTFFEMLGNFSFGDYFKKEAIKYAWELLTEIYKISPDKLWITVHIEDQESEKIWLNEIGIQPDRISKLDDDNFWSMGDTGPCGPCSEIFFDHGEAFSGESPAEGVDTGDRFVEIYNLVFMQFNRSPDGELSPLPKPSVDTGMGLERITAVLQGINDNYETDLFKDLIKKIASNLGALNLENPSLRVIADHLRSSSYLIADGLSISNEGRGYVLRRIIRRALRHAHKLNPDYEKPLSGLVKELVSQMGKEHALLSKNKKIIEKTIEKEEQQFSLTLRNGMRIFEDETPKDVKEVSGELAFKLYDTFGFPLDMTIDLAREKNIAVNIKEYEELMEQQRDLAKASSNFDSLMPSSISLDKPTNFIGYDKSKCKSKVLKIFVNLKEQEILEGDSDAILILNKTPFYAESGGQVGDQGSISGEDFIFEVKDTQKVGDQFIHIGNLQKGTLKVGSQCESSINVDRRNKIIRNHSATHLLHSALRNVLGEHVEQKGSLVSDKYFRFDFTHDAALKIEEVQQIENLVNETIRNNISTKIETMSFKKAQDKGALAFFGDKYGDEVRVLSIGGDFSVELCGGIHVDSAGDIGFVKVTGESSISSGVRRIEACSGKDAEDFSNKFQNSGQEAMRLLNVNEEGLISKIKELMEKNSELEKSIKSSQQKELGEVIKSLDQDIIQINSYKVILKEFEGINLGSARSFIDELKNKNENLICVLASKDGDKSSLLVSSSKSIPKDVFSSNDLLQSLASLIGGKGGGKPDHAQAGGSQVKNFEKVFSEATKYIQNL
jgi:alanyl-tRNA synthetase